MAEAASIFAECEMQDPVFVDVAGGRAAIYSRGSPTRSGANEDGAAILPAGPRGVLAVADGVGGQPAGASASRHVLESLRDAVAACDPQRSLRGPILDALERGNAALLEKGGGAAATLAVAEIDEQRVRPYHVGDAGILVVGQRGKRKLLTVSHSPVGYALEAGLLDERDALHHEARHLISNAVGARDMRIEVGSPLRLAARDTLLLASDGVFDNLEVDEIIEIVRTGPLDDAATVLAHRARDRMATTREGAPSKPDDLTFVLFRRGAAGTRSPA